MLEGGSDGLGAVEGIIILLRFHVLDRHLLEDFDELPLILLKLNI